MFKNIKIGLRLTLGFSLMIVFTIVLIIIGIRQMKADHDNLDRVMKEVNVRIRLANNMIDNSREVALSVRGLLIKKYSNQSEASINEMREEWVNQWRAYDQNIEEMEKLILQECQIGHQLFLKLQASSDTARQLTAKAIEIVLSGNVNAATNFVFSTAYPSVQRWIKNNQDFILHSEEHAEIFYDEAHAEQLRARITMLILGILSIALSAVIVIFLTLSITRPMNLSVHAANRIASGDLTADISPTERKDEVGILTQAFHQMVENLRRYINDIVFKNRIAQIFMNISDEKMYDEVLKVILEAMDSKLGVFGYIDEDGALIVPSMSRGAWWDQCNVPDKDIKFPCDTWGNGSWPRALREKKVNYTNEISNLVPKGHIPINKHISMPIMFRGQVIGLIQVANREADYGEKDIIFLEELFAQIAPNLMARVQRDREEKRRKHVENNVKETVKILAETSSAILAATTQVSSGSAEAATAISQTTTTVEEVQQAAKLSSQKAKNVADSAQQVVQVSQNGQKAVEETVKSMNRISEQMDLIAQTILRLSEQSQSIGGIIASVTNIADQSNLLAVNAAIEAAKAGEQGKGFAVVAQEIKNLAALSKQATSQVRNILNDVQKSTSAAVMATEQGNKAVEAGVKQSGQTGETIRILAESINKAVEAATQIVASSQQQVVGMDQIGVAMQNINQAGTETAVSMVQSEKSAKSLNELGQKLKEMVERFKE